MPLTMESRMDRLEQRLERIESKLDLIVRLEERQTNSDDSIRRAFHRIEKLEENINKLMVTFSSEQVKTGVNQKGLGWIFGVLGTVVGALVVWSVKG